MDLDPSTQQMSKAEVVSHLKEKIFQATGLDEFQSKTLIYAATATYSLKDLECFPIITIYGPFGTGKTTIGRIFASIAWAAEIFSGQVSNAVLRSKLGKCRTAVIEEADEINGLWISNRYSKSTSKIDFNQQTIHGWASNAVDIFGATVLHRRKPLSDAALQSRSIQITTAKQPGPFSLDTEALRDYQEQLSDISEAIDWSVVNSLGGTRIKDTWAPVLAVAVALNDQEYLGIASLRIAKEEAAMEVGQEGEPTQMAYSALLALALHNEEGQERSVPLERVLIASVRDVLGADDMQLNGQQVGLLLRELGFDTQKVGGQQYVFTGGVSGLVEVGLRIQCNDEWLTRKAGN